MRINICNNGSRKEVKYARLKLNEEHCSITKIAKTGDRSRKVMTNLLKDPVNSGKREGCGRPRCVTVCQAPLRDKLQKKLELRRMIRNVRRLLKDYEHLKRRKLRRNPRLKQEHEQFAEKRVYMNKKWRRVICIDEKSFNVDLMVSTTIIVIYERSNNLRVVDPEEAAV